MSTIVHQSGHKRVFSSSDSSSEDEDLDVEESLERVPRHFRRRFLMPLVEVFSVCISKFRECHLYGTITITEGIFRSYLYNRKKEESEFMCPGDHVLLTGPPHSISALDNFIIDVDLMDRDADIPPDHVGSPDRRKSCYDPLEWNSYHPNKKLDKPLYEEFKSKFCSVGVTYIVFEVGVQATVNVTLIILDPNYTPNVFGSIAAGNSNFPQESVLFQKASHAHIDVRSGQLIPLSRSVVSVPLKSVLIVRANLLDYCADSSSVIADGTAEFPVYLSRKIFDKRILGQGFEIRVMVNFTGDWE